MSPTSSAAIVQAGIKDTPATPEVEAAFLEFFSRIEPIAPGLAQRATTYVLRGGEGLAEIARHQAAANSAFKHNVWFLPGPAADYVARSSLPAAVRLAEVRDAIAVTAQAKAAHAAAGVDGRLIAFWRTFQFSPESLPIDWSRAAAEHWGLTETTLIASLYQQPNYWLMQMRRKTTVGLGPFLIENAAVVRSALDRLEPAAVKALFADVVHFKKLTGALLEVVLDAATSSRIPLTKAARALLTHAEEIELYDRLKGRLANGSETERREAAMALSQHVGAKARDVLRTAAERESSATAKVGIETALGLIDTVASWNAGRPAAIPPAHSAIVAVDGSWHLIPEPEPMPEEKPLRRGCRGGAAQDLRGLQFCVGSSYAQTWQGPPMSAKRSSRSGRIHHRLYRDGRARRDGPAPACQSGRRCLQFAQPTDRRLRAVGSQEACCRGADAAAGGAARRLLFRDLGNSLIHELIHSAGDARLAPLRALIDQGVDFRLLMQIYKPVERYSGTRDVTPAEVVAKAFGNYDFNNQMPEVLSPSMFYFYLEHLDVVEEALGETKAERVLDFIETWPFVPASLLQVLLQFGLVGHKQSRGRARALLASTDIATLLITRLADKDKAVRYAAADWIGRRRIAQAEPALRTALAGERTDEGRAAMLTALSRIGADISAAFDVRALEAEARKGLAKVAPEQLSWFPFHELPQLRWRNGEAVSDVIILWWVVQADKLKDPAGNAMLELSLDRLMPDDAGAFGLLVLKTFVDIDTRTIAAADALAEAEREADRIMLNAVWAQKVGRQQFVELVRTASICKGSRAPANTAAFWVSASARLGRRRPRLCAVTSRTMVKRSIRRRRCCRRWRETRLQRRSRACWRQLTA